MLREPDIAAMTARSLVFALTVSALAACASPDAPDDRAVPIRTAAVEADDFSVPADSFGAYWYQGLAEITSYDLEQARYGEIHPGEAVLIYVTEPFLEDEQVKADDPDAEGAVTVLKLNATRNFLTGVYPYSMMMSVFTPVQREEHGPTLKVTATSQEWCGHTFTQLGRIADGYRLQLFSYFESEGDQDRTLDSALLEDGLWTTLRLNPDALPTGELRLVPGTIYQRLSHLDLEPHAATATLSDDPEAPGLQLYTLTYPDLDRTLTIRFTADFPHTIEGWTETRRSGFGPDAQVLTTTATRRARDLMAYWSLNSRADVPLREALGLDG
jgi:hypothetical protein